MKFPLFVRLSQYVILLQDIKPIITIWHISKSPYAKTVSTSLTTLHVPSWISHLFNTALLTLTLTTPTTKMLTHLHTQATATLSWALTGSSLLYSLYLCDEIKCLCSSCQALKIFSVHKLVCTKIKFLIIPSDGSFSPSQIPVFNFLLQS